jgi:NAD-dependent deacetylase
VEPDGTDHLQPLCPNCGSPLRPDVVWFGESLPVAELEAASEAARSCDVLLSVGTSGLVYPAASLPYEALENGAVVVEVNPERTPLSRARTFRCGGVRARSSRGSSAPRSVSGGFSGKSPRVV